MHRPLALAVLCALSVAALGAQQAPASTDWPQWRGPNRDGISAETGLLQSWPRGGPPVVWSISGLGAGYGAVAIKGTRAFVQGLRGRETMVHSLNVADGAYLPRRCSRCDPLLEPSLFILPDP
jgi:hypothetical protein